jgi:hypothetical protein
LAALLAVDDPIAFQGPNVHGVILESSRVFVLLHTILKVQVICVARASFLDLNNLIIKLPIDLQSLLVDHLDGPKRQLVHIHQEVFLVDQAGQDVLDIIAAITV